MSRARSAPHLVPCAILLGVVACATPAGDRPEARARAAERVDAAEQRSRAAERVDRTDPPNGTVVIPGQVDLDTTPDPVLPPPRPRGPDPEARTPGTPLSPAALPQTTRGDAQPITRAIDPARVRLLDEVRAALAQGGAPARTLDVSLAGDALVLTGVVDTEADKAIVEELARAKAGAAPIENRLVVREK